MYEAWQNSPHTSLPSLVLSGFFGPVMWILAKNLMATVVTVDSNSTTDIKARLVIARHATLQLTGIWKAKDIGMDLKKQLVQSLIWSTTLYGPESWALKK